MECILSPITFSLANICMYKVVKLVDSFYTCLIRDYTRNLDLVYFGLPTLTS